MPVVGQLATFALIEAALFRRLGDIDRLARLAEYFPQLSIKTYRIFDIQMMSKACALLVLGTKKAFAPQPHFEYLKMRFEKKTRLFAGFSRIALRKCLNDNFQA